MIEVIDVGEPGRFERQFPPDLIIPLFHDLEQFWDGKESRDRCFPVFGNHAFTRILLDLPANNIDAG